MHSGQAVDWRLLATVFADDKAPKFGALASTQDALEHAWGDFAFIFERKFCQVCKGDAAEVIRFAEAQEDPEVTPVSLEAVAAAGYTEQSRALYDAISSSCHMGSAPMRAVRKLQASKNGCAAWQALHFKYRPHLSGDDEVDKELLRIEHSVPEAQIEARLDQYELQVANWERRYGRDLPEEEKRASLLKCMPLTERQGVLREMVVSCMGLKLTYQAIKSKVVASLQARRAGAGSAEFRGGPAHPAGGGSILAASE